MSLPWSVNWTKTDLEAPLGEEMKEPLPVRPELNRLILSTLAARASGTSIPGSRGGLAFIRLQVSRAAAEAPHRFLNFLPG